MGDAFMTGRREMVIERDDFQGAAAVTQQIYRVDLVETDAEGFATRTLVLDELKIASPARRTTPRWTWWTVARSVRLARAIPPSSGIVARAATGEIKAFVGACMDGVFSDNPDLAVVAVG